MSNWADLAERLRLLVSHTGGSANLKDGTIGIIYTGLGVWVRLFLGPRLGGKKGAWQQIFLDEYDALIGVEEFLDDLERRVNCCYGIVLKRPRL